MRISQRNMMAADTSGFWQKLLPVCHLRLERLARPEGFEPPTPWFVGNNRKLSFDSIDKIRVAPVAFGTTKHNRA
jgi:hypothetical protein